MTTLIVACGGEVRSGAPGDSGKSDDPPDDPTSTGGAKSSGSGDRSHLPQVDLPECKKGEPVPGSLTKKCAYVYDGLCYEGKLDACACACKKLSGTICSSEFPTDGVPTEVSCF